MSNSQTSQRELIRMVVVRFLLAVFALLVMFFLPAGTWVYWAMIPAVLIIPLIVARIRNEERVLVRDLKGYPEYMLKMRYRLIPGLR